MLNNITSNLIAKDNNGQYNAEVDIQKLTRLLNDLINQSNDLEWQLQSKK